MSNGTTSERGYGWQHQQLRAAWQPLVAAGEVNCWRCEEPINPDEAWHLGHDDDDRDVYRGPEHPSCNLLSAAQRGAAVTNAKRSMISREW